MKPLPDLPNRDEAPDETASRAIWALVFIGLGVMLAANRPMDHGGWYAIAIGASFAAAAYFLYLLLVRRN